MPLRLRPTAPIAADAILVGDPGRALLLAQELLDSPKMSNHARGLWGYTGRTPAGDELTLQSTGMGGPSAALVLADLAELGVRRAVRIGTCHAIAAEAAAGELLVVSEAHAWSGGRGGEAVLPDAALTQRLRDALAGGPARTALIASLDEIHLSEAASVAGGDLGSPSYMEATDAADMQTAGLLSAAQRSGVVAAATLIVAETASGERADDECVGEAAVRAGKAAAAALEGEPNPRLEG